MVEVVKEGGEKGEGELLRGGGGKRRGGEVGVEGKRRGSKIGVREEGGEGGRSERGGGQGKRMM